MRRRSPTPLVLLVLVLVGAGCSDDATSPDTGRIDLGMFYTPDVSILFDNLDIRNAAGQTYSITNFDYFLSDVRFFHSTGGADHATGEVHLFAVGSTDPDFDDFLSFPDVPAGTYDRLSFTFGLDEMTNVAGGLPSLAPIDAMAWPEPLGGGYHYMILEGLWIADRDTTLGSGTTITAGDTLGYATHTGRVGSSPHSFTVTLELSPPLVLEAGRTWRIPVDFDTRKWYEGVHLYRFPWEPFIMNDETAQTRLMENGMDYESNEMFLARPPEPQAFATD